MEAKKLQEKAMLVKYEQSFWEARKHDKAITQEIEQTKGIKGRYHKHLLDDMSTLETCAKHRRKIYQYHIFHTLPWTHEGTNVLPVKLFDKYSAGMRELFQRDDQLIETWKQEYPHAVEETRVIRTSNGHNGFDITQYPDVGEFDRLYRKTIKIFPIPDIGDFRCAMANEEFERMKQNGMREVLEHQTTMNKQVFFRIVEVVSKLHEAMKDGDKTFRDTKIKNIIRLLDILPGLNLSDDPELDRIRKEVEDKLTRNTPDVLRDNKEIRKQTAEEAEKILDQMKGYC